LVINLLEATAPFTPESLHKANSEDFATFRDSVRFIPTLCIFILATSYRVYARDIRIMSLSAAGFCLMQATATMPAWRAQHFSAHKDGGKKNVYALFRDNDHRHVSIIQNVHRHAWNIEDMAASPGTVYNYSTTLEIYTAAVTFVACLVYTVFLTSVPDELAAILIVALIIGTFSNLYDIYPNQTYGVPLESVDVISHDKIMTTLQALEEKYPGFGKPLIKEFFPDGLSEHDKKWWDTVEKSRLETSEEESRDQPAETSKQGLGESTVIVSKENDVSEPLTKPE
jgi:hypothetical protein